MSSRHQSHYVVNRNRRLRLAGLEPDRPIVTSGGYNDLSIHELDGRLKVCPVRDFDIVIPHNINWKDGNLKEVRNPINQLGGIPLQEVPVATVNSFESFMAAFNKRCNFDQAGPDDDISDAMYAEALTIINNINVQFDAWDENDADRARWLAKFAPPKQKAMEAAFATVSDATYRHVGTKDLMVKNEILIKRNDDGWAPRIIYAGNDAFNAVTGPAAMITMERMVALTKATSIGDVKIQYAYKTTDVELCNFLSEDPTCTYHCEGDFSRNDREQRSRVAKLFDVWLGKLNMPTWYRKLNLEIENFAVQSRQWGFYANMRFQLPTGTTNTTTRNSFYNSVMFAVICKLQKTSGRAIILGDDILAALRKRLDIRAWVAAVAEFKMVLKGKDVALDGEASFLSRRFITGVPQPVMLPLLGKMLVRFNARGTQGQCSDSQYMAGKALSYAYECRHVPMLRDIFLERYHMEADHKKVDSSNLTWFAKSCGVNVDNLLEFITNEPHLVDDWDFGLWTCTHYDLDFVQVEAMFRAIVTSTTLELVDLPYLDNMRQDI